MVVSINIEATDWQAVAQELAGENMRLRAALQAAGRELNQLTSRVKREEVDEAAGPSTDNDNPNDDERKE